MANVRVRLFYADGREVPVGADEILGTSDDAIGNSGNPDSGGLLTNLSGNFSFKGLSANNYLIKIFRSGKSSCSILSNNPNNNIDSDNNGTIGTGSNSSFIVSSIFTTAAGDHGLQGNTIVNNDNETASDSTVDFGMILSPTAAAASVGGRITTANGRGIYGARITIVNSTGTNAQTTSTNPFGYYRFAEVAVGETYIITVRHKNYYFSPSSQVLSLTEAAENVNFTASPR